jgi:glycosidase
MAFDFDAAKGLLDAIASGDAAPARVALCGRLSGFGPRGLAGTFLTNHDQRRAASELRTAGPAALRLAASALLTWPGTPWLYYGEEIGMANGAGAGDEAKRLPMQWQGGAGAGFTTGDPWLAPASDAAADSVAGQRSDPSSLLRHYQALIAQRRARAVLRRGATALIAAAMGSAGPPLVLQRTLGTETLWLVHHFGREASAVTLPASALTPALRFVDALGGGAWERADAQAALTVTLGPFGFALLVAEGG